MVTSSPSGSGAAGWKRGGCSNACAGCRPIGGEAQAGGGAAFLAIEDAGNDRVGIMRGQAAHEIDRLLVGAEGGRLDVPERDIEVTQQPAAPAHREMRLLGLTVDSDNDFFEERAQEFFAIAIGRRWRGPHAWEKSLAEASHRIACRSSDRACEAVVVLGARVPLRRPASDCRQRSHSASNPRATRRLSGSTAR